MGHRHDSKWTFQESQTTFGSFAFRKCQESYFDSSIATTAVFRAVSMSKSWPFVNHNMVKIDQLGQNKLDTSA